MPRRGKRHYTEIWAEEDGQFSLDNNQHDKDKLPPNQPRGNLEQMTDEIAETDQISNGPMLNRLLSTMRFENRPSPSSDDGIKPNGASTNGDVPMVNGLPNGDTNSTTDHHHPKGEQIPSSSQPPPTTNNNTTLPSATSIPESALPSSFRSSSTSLKMDAATIDDRLKQELRYIGFLPPSDPTPSTTNNSNHNPITIEQQPDYDAHYDDEVAERLRALQDELRRVSLENGARKARILELANERMAHQEYATILEDLDQQVQQAYLKRTRTLGKSRKNVKRPAAAGGAHLVNGVVDPAGAGAGAVGVSKPGIGDVARQLMERRKKWVDVIGGVFDDDGDGGAGGRGGVGMLLGGDGKGKGKGTIFEEGVMEGLIKVERERWEEETE